MKKTWKRRFAMDELAVARPDQDFYHRNEPVKMSVEILESREVQARTRIWFDLPHGVVCRLPDLVAIDVILRFESEEEE